MSSASMAAFPIRSEIADPARRAAIETALDYMGLKAGAPIMGTPVDWVFIGSCTNSRMSDLRAAAAIARGRKVAPGVRAWVVPGSETVKREAVAEGLDKLFIEAGFEWREPGCSMCLAANGEMRRARPALGLDLQPQFHRPAGPARAHPSGEPGDGGGRRDLGRDRRRANDGAIDAESRLTSSAQSQLRSCAAISIPTSSFASNAWSATPFAARSANGRSARCAICRTVRKIRSSS